MVLAPATLLASELAAPHNRLVAVVRRAIREAVRVPRGIAPPKPSEKEADAAKQSDHDPAGRVP